MSTLMFIYYVILACFAIIPWVWYFILKAKANKKEAAEKNADSPRPDMPATRQWVEQQLNAKTANCVTPAGETVKRLEAKIDDAIPYYYLLLGEDSHGDKIGRLFEGKPCGLEMTKPFMYQGLSAHPLNTPQSVEYGFWTDKAKARYEFDCDHSMPEENSSGNCVHEKICLAHAIRILLWAASNGHLAK